MKQTIITAAILFAAMFSGYSIAGTQQQKSTSGSTAYSQQDIQYMKQEIQEMKQEINQMQKDITLLFKHECSCSHH